MKIKNQTAFKRYAEWLGRTITAGVPVAAYPCPHCGANLNTTLPVVGSVADSLTTCAVCEELFFKVVDNTHGDPVVITSIKPMIA